MNTIPPTWKELEAAGFVWQSRTNCKNCGREMEWWKSPSGRWIPVELVAEAGGARMVHTMLCPKADQFQRQAVTDSFQEDEVKMSKKEREKARYRRNAKTGTLFKL